jgi:hypothetical protein
MNWLVTVQHTRAQSAGPSPSSPRWMRRSAASLGLALLTVLAAWPAQAPAEDAPPPPRGPSLDKLFDRLQEKIQSSSLPPFLRDMDLRVNFRTYYFNRNQPDDTKNEALAFGGSISLQSGWLFDTFAMGATLYGSAPLYAPDDRDGTLLLKPGQEGYYVPGEAWGALRYKEYALLKGYRQQVNQTYINPQDNRMTPNTFEALTLGGKVGWLQYLAGYLWNIKTRNSDDFVAMSSAAGVQGRHDGVGLAGVRLTPIENLRLDVSNQYGVNMFNTLYAEAEYLHTLNEDWKLRIGVQITDQRSVGDANVGGTVDKFWTTQSGGGRVQVIYRDLTLTGAFTVNGNGNTIQNPWGSYPGYLAMIELDFDRANEKGWLIGAAYDFSKVLIPGLSANFNIAWGRDAINPSTRQKAPDQTEYDFTADYRFPRSAPAFLQGVWFRARSAILDQAHARALGYQFRLILNWERDLI